MPATLTGAATLAPLTGKVTKIEKGIAGGYHVHMGTASAFVPKGLDLKVKVGSRVEAGDMLSDGVIKPQDLVALKGMLPAQQYIVSELQSAYKGQGVSMPKRIFETVVRSLGNTTKILNHAEGSGYIPGDMASYQSVAHYNRNLEVSLPTHDAAGYKLAERTGQFNAGHELTQKDIDVLTRDGVASVQIKKDAIKHAPTLQSIQLLPSLRADWMGSLGYRGLEKALTEGASMNRKTDTSGYHPVPALVHGSTFGQGREGRY